MNTNCPFCGSEYIRTQEYEDYFSCGTIGLSGSFETYANRTPLCHALERGNKLEKELAEAKEQSGTYYARHKIAREEAEELRTQNAKLRTLLERALINWGLVRGKAYEEIKMELEAL